MIRHNKIPKIDWAPPLQQRQYGVWSVEMQTGYHGTSSVTLDSILKDGALKAANDKCGRNEFGVFFGVDYENKEGYIIRGFEHAFLRSSIKTKENGGNQIIFEIEVEMIQTSRLEPWIAKIGRDVAFTEIKAVYLLNPLSTDIANLSDVGFIGFQEYKYDSKEFLKLTR